MIPSAGVITIEAISESTIMIAENNPNVLNSPIDEVAMIAKPATSEIAEPTDKYTLHLPRVGLAGDSFLSLSSRYLSVT